MAIKAGGIPLPHGAPTFLASPVWSYVPVILVTIAGFIALRRALSGDVASQRSSARSPPEPLAARPPSPALADEHAPPPQLAGREYVPASFAKQYIALMNAAHTSAQVNALLAPHAGQWIRLRLVLADVNRSGDGLHAIMRTEMGNGSHFGVDFPRKWEAHLARVKAGEVIGLDAQIVETGQGVTLQNCELL